MSILVRFFHKVL